MRNGTYLLEPRRYRGVPVENRPCKLCHEEVETEEHFLTSCIKQNDIRQNMITYINADLRPINIVFQTLSSVEK